MKSNSLHIAGGTYFEYCVFPEWSEFYGSGLRSVMALSNFTSSLEFHTYIDQTNSKRLNTLASINGFRLSTTLIPQTFTFDYLHPFSPPFIYPSPDRIEKTAPIKIKGDNILRFGILEGEAIVEGKRVVYDPQSPNNPVQFNINGSKASQLAIVLNLQEAIKLSSIKVDQTPNINTIKMICNKICRENNASTIIIKNGPKGLYIFDGHKVQYKPPLKTKKVWLIGSGDIFTSFFAYNWAVKRYSVIKSVDKAMESTAFYCGTSVLPTLRNALKQFGFDPKPLRNKKKIEKKIVYLAAPFFDISQLWFVNEILSILRKFGLSVISPFHDVKYTNSTTVAKKDMKLIKKSSLLFAILDGMDSGTIFEIGYARALRKPVIIYKTRKSEKNLTMMSGSDCQIYDDLSTALYQTYWKLAEL